MSKTIRPVNISRSPRRQKNLSAAVSKYFLHPVSDLLDCSEKLQEWVRLERNQWEPIEQKRKRQWEQLQAALRYARENCEFYRNRIPTAPPDEVEFRRLPLLQKDDVRRFPERLISRAFSRSVLREATTGGSTSMSLKVFFNKRCQERRNAVAMRCDRWAGWDLGHGRGALWGNPPPIVTPKQRLRNALLDRITYLDTLRLTDKAMMEFIRRLRDKGIHFLFGHAHSLFVFANFVRSREIRDLDIRGIVATSMVLLERERYVIESVFGCPVTNRYGCEEVGLIACECEMHDGLHVNVDHLYVEVLREDGSPAAPGEDGRIVVTDLINRGMPFIRYEVGDMGKTSNRACSCGRGLPLLEKINGRMADFFVRLDGSLVAGVSLVERTLTAFPGISQLQIVQERLGEMTLNVVPDHEYGLATEEGLIREIRSVFEPETTVIVAMLTAIPQERNGKYRFAICRVPHLGHPSPSFPTTATESNHEVTKR